MAKFGQAGNSRDNLAYLDSRLPTVPTVDFNRAPTTTDVKFPIQTIGRDNTTGDEYILTRFVNGEAQWVLFTAGGGDVTGLKGDDGTAVTPDSSGNITINGKVVANGTRSKPLWVEGTAASNKEELEIQVGSAITGAPADKNDAGLLSVDDTQFKVDANGYLETLLTSDGEFLIGNASKSTGKVGSLTSPNGSVTINYNDPDIELEVNDSSGEQTVQTTDATPTTLATISVPTDNSMTIEGHYIAREASTSNTIGGNFLAIVEDASGTVSVVGTNIINENSDFSTANVDIVASGGNALVQVTGEAATTINWRCRFKTLEQSA